MVNAAKNVDSMTNNEKLRYWQDVVSRPGALDDYHVVRVDGDRGDKNITILLEQVDSSAD